MWCEHRYGSARPRLTPPRHEEPSARPWIALGDGSLHLDQFGVLGPETVDLVGHRIVGRLAGGGAQLRLETRQGDIELGPLVAGATSGRILRTLSQPRNSTLPETA